MNGRKAPASGSTRDLPIRESLNVNSIRITEDYGDKVIVEAEVIHAGRTRNNTIYPEEELAAAAQTFVTPYLKPVLRHHIMWQDAIGRTLDARFVQSGIHGVPAIRVVAEITDPDAIEKVRDGRYHTISIGARAQEVYCSICGTNLIEEDDWREHKHQRGYEYDGQVAGWVLRKLSFEEWSYVNQPSDVLAANIRVDGRNVTTQGGHGASSHVVGENVNESEKSQEPAPETKKKEYRIPFSIGSRREAYIAHQVLHEWAKDPSKTSYTPEEIRKEHERIVRIMLNREWTHLDEGDRLDRSLPENLRRRSKKASGTRSAASAAPLRGKGGNSEPMATEEQLRLELKAVQDELESVNEANEKLEKQLAEANENLAKLQAENKDLMTQIEQMTEKIRSLEKSQEELHQTNEALVSDLVQALAERMADYRIALGKAGTKERDELVETYAKRSLDSLKDSISDMKQEWLESASQFIPVERPGLANVNEAKAYFPNLHKGEEHKESMDEPTALATLFGGLRRK